MKIKLPTYSSKDYLVLALVIIPITFIVNMVIFGRHYFGNLFGFVVPSVITAFAFCIDFILCGAVAVLMKKRFPHESDTVKKLSLMITMFIVITGLFLSLLFKGYESIERLNYRFNQAGFVWAYMSMSIINIFLTLLMEGIDRFDNWKQSLRETEELRKNFRQSQLQGLKSQLNPHFLFNSLNSLSSLICCGMENEAETFLNEMSKVYRYMLRNEDEQLVTLETELKFVDSYMHLLKARYCDGIKLQLDIQEEDKQKLVPALSLQVLLENAFTLNCVTRRKPLSIKIASAGDDRLFISNSINPKQSPEAGTTLEEMDNLVNKYQLLNMPQVQVNETSEERLVLLPLICNKEEVMS